ncbi:MAG: beta-ketoacyl-ACP synthase II [Candidatus Eiseniibacteriota bacterium]|nr:MAG: beta-ketoacyl-ACP synthase II [Candidatus Eisenbacteria bacterium]
MERVLVTGLGVVSPVGLSAPEFWKNLCEGKSGAGRVTKFDATGFDTTIAAELKGFNPENHMDRKDVKRADPFVQYAVAACGEAIKDSGLDLESVDKERVGVVIGTGIGGIATFEAQHAALLQKGPSRVSPFFIPMMIGDMAAGQVSMKFLTKGPNFATVSACASGAHAIGEALRLLQKGDADVMIAGGTEATITPMAMAGFCSMKALTTRNDEPEKASRPFDKERDGFLMGEGAGMVILETMTHALSRGARVYSELTGYGATADAFHLTAPAPKGEGAARAMKLALEDSGLSPESVQYINAHGTSTPLNDKLETMAVKTVFGEHAKRLVLASTKSMTGHLLGAAGGIEFAACVLSIRDSIIPPTINYEFPDEECDLDCAPNKAKRQTVTVALSNSLGFGGHNATLATKKFEK